MNTMTVPVGVALHLETVADQLMDLLLHAGVQEVFGVPGGAVEPYFDAIARAQDRGDVRCVIARHETAALTMAEGTVREGRPFGVCCATSGPGALNMMSAAASALLEQQPVLIITGQAPLAKFGQGPVQDSSCSAVDVVAALKAVTKYSTLVSHPGQLHAKLIQALTLAKAAPAGPVHLSIPSDVLSSAAVPGAMVGDLPKVSKVAASSEQLQRVAHRIDIAKRPVLLLGEEANESMGAILQLLEAYPLPVVTTAAGHQQFPTTHPCFVGVHGFAGHSPAVEVVRNADFVLMLGSHSRELCGGNALYLRKPHVVAVSASSDTLAQNLGAGVFVHSDIGELVTALKEKFQFALQPIKLPGFLMPEPPEHASTNLLCPVRGLRELWKMLPEDTHVYLDAGNAWSWGIHYLDIGKNVSRMTTSMGFGQMAWAIPAAIGAALARKRQKGRTVCVTGDGSWLMSSHELTVAVQCQLPILFVVLNDAHLGMVYHGQRMTGACPIGHELPQVDFAAMAKACGARAHRVHSLEELVRLRASDLFDVAGPVLLDLCVDPEAVPPMRARVEQLRDVSKGTV